MIRISELDNDTYTWLIENVPCTISINGSTVFEGMLEDYNIPVDDESIMNRAVVKFIDESISENPIIMLMCENDSIIKEAKEIINNRSIESIIKEDVNLFNELMNIANDLPLLNVIDESFADYKNIEKYGINYQKLVELSLIWNHLMNTL